MTWFPWARTVRPVGRSRQAARPCELRWMPAQELVRTGPRCRLFDREASVFTEKPISVCGVQIALGQEQYFVSINYDYGARAQAALRWAMAATCERERLSWVRVALAWQDLDRGDEGATISIASMYSLSFAGNWSASVLPSDHPTQRLVRMLRSPAECQLCGAFRIIKRRVHPPAAR